MDCSYVIAFSCQNDWTSKRHYNALDVTVNQRIILSVGIFNPFIPTDDKRQRMKKGLSSSRVSVVDRPQWDDIVYFRPRKNSSRLFVSLDQQ